MTTNCEQPARHQVARGELVGRTDTDRTEQAITAWLSDDALPDGSPEKSKERRSIWPIRTDEPSTNLEGGMGPRTESFTYPEQRCGVETGRTTLTPNLGDGNQSTTRNHCTLNFIPHQYLIVPAIEGVEVTNATRPHGMGAEADLA